MKRFFAIVFALITVMAFAGCSKKGVIHYDIGNVDAATYFNREYDGMVEKYGKAELKGDKLTGVAVVRLIDFTGNGNYEMYIAYADGTQDYVNRHKVVGFDRGSATILDEEITSKEKAEDEFPSIWLYKDPTGRGYVVTGDVLTQKADYRTYVRTRNEEAVYAFVPEFTVDAASEDEVIIDGTYEKIRLAGLTQEDAEFVFEDNTKVVDSIKGWAKR